MLRYRHWPALLTACVLSLLSTPVRAGQTIDERLNVARRHVSLASSQFRQHRYAQAAKQWFYAYEIVDEPALLFNVAQAYRLAKDYARARDFYRKYLTRLPGAPNRAEARERLAEMTSKAGEAPPP